MASLLTSQFTYAGEDLNVLAVTVNYRNWMLSYFQRFIQGRTMEIGAGCGTISQEISPWTTQLTLIEPDPQLATKLQYRFMEKSHVSIHQENAQQHLQSTQDSTYESILLINVLEHIQDDQTVLAHCARVLTPGGHLLLFVPALPALYAAMDAHLGHYRRYERTSLEQKIMTCGLRIELLRYFDLPGILSWLLLKTSRSTRFNPLMVKIYDRWIVPPTRWLEHHISPPLGKNLLLVACKEST